MNEEYEKHIKEFLESIFKLSFEFPEFEVDNEKPETSFEFSEVKMKKDRKNNIKTVDGSRKPKSKREPKSKSVF